MKIAKICENDGIGIFISSDILGPHLGQCISAIPNYDLGQVWIYTLIECFWTWVNPCKASRFVLTYKDTRYRYESSFNRFQLNENLVHPLVEQVR